MDNPPAAPGVFTPDTLSVCLNAFLPLRLLLALAEAVLAAISICAEFDPVPVPVGLVVWITAGFACFTTATGLGILAAFGDEHISSFLLDF
jgi:hypothetical protein